MIQLVRGNVLHFTLFTHKYVFQTSGFEKDTIGLQVWTTGLSCMS